MSKLTIGLSLALSGRYAAMGRQAEAALSLFVSDLNAEGGLRAAGKVFELALNCIDDESDPRRCAEIYRSLCDEHRAEIIFGPYGSNLTRVAAPIAEQAGMLLINHSGADDALHTRGNRLLVSVLSPASAYLRPFVRLLAGLKLWRKRLAILRSSGGFAEAVARGVELECGGRFARRKGVRIRLMYVGNFDPNETPATLFPALKRNHVNAVVSAGSYQHDVELMRAVAGSSLNLPVLACVAAGVARFRDDLGESADGIVGPSQWEESAALVPELGPGPREFARRMRVHEPDVGCDYPAAQAYAAGLLLKEAIQAAQEVDQHKMREAFSDLRTSTLFGAFAIDRVTGLQIAHQMMLVQWHEGRKIVIEPEPILDRGAMEFPSGWKLLLASRHLLKFRGAQHDSGENEDEPG